MEELFRVVVGLRKDTGNRVTFLNIHCYLISREFAQSFLILLLFIIYLP